MQSCVPKFKVFSTGGISTVEPALSSEMLARLSLNYTVSHLRRLWFLRLWPNFRSSYAGSTKKIHDNLRISSLRLWSWDVPRTNQEYWSRNHDDQFAQGSNKVISFFAFITEFRKSEAMKW